MARSSSFRRVLHEHGLELGDEIDQGGQGSVHLARGAGGQQVAVKRLTNLKRRQRFEREVLTMKRLREEGCFVLPEVLGAHVDDGLAFFWMPYYPDGSLQRRLDERSVSEPLDMCRQLVAAVEMLHVHGVAHRDLKPDNVLFLDGEILLADFGLCLTADDPRVTDTFEQAGSRFYMAPELRDGRLDDPDHRAADLYSLAKMLWCLLTGRERPFDREPPHWEPPQLELTLLADLQLNSVVTLLKAWMSQRPDERLLVEPAELLDSIEIASRPPERIARAGPRPDVLNAIRRDNERRSFEAARRDEALTLTDQGQREAREQKLRQWASELQGVTADAVRASPTWDTYCAYGDAAPDTLRLIGGGPQISPRAMVRELVDQPSGSDDLVDPAAKHRDELWSEVIWMVKVVVHGKPLVVYALEASITDQYVEYHACAARYDEQTGYRISVRDFPVIEERHVASRQSARLRAGEIAIELVQGVIRLIEKTFLETED